MITDTKHMWWKPDELRALQKCCPMSMSAEAGRYSFCVADTCMAWYWHVDFNKSKQISASDPIPEGFIQISKPYSLIGEDFIDIAPQPTVGRCTMVKP